LTNGATPTITAIGKGAFIGFYKLGVGIEVQTTNPIVVPTSITYNIVKLTDDAVDTLIIEGNYAGGPGYWRFCLVHYDNPADEPPIPGPKPTAGFTVSTTGTTSTFTNTTQYGVTYAWDFGDGGTSTAQDPTHTYATAGPYIVTMTATNPNGTAASSHRVFISSGDITDAILQGAAWHNIVDNLVIFVGPNPGDDSWWSVSKAQLDGTNAGTADDWACIVDDEFKFSAGGVFGFDTKGTTRNDGYFGAPSGCIDDAGIAASALGAPFGTYANHSYVLTPASGTTKATITLTSPAGHAAFLGFYKGYNGVASGVKGGENNGTDPANFGSLTNTYTVLGYAHVGTKEYLFVTVDITGDHAGTNAWSAILTR
jgi:PKD repeat protein